MLSKVEKKDLSTQMAVDKFDLTSSGRAEFTQEGSDIDLYIDTSNPIHISWLQGWCRAHWLSTFKRALMYGNSLYYHSCCNCYSRRTFCLTAGHPVQCTTNIRKLRGFKEVDSATALFLLILDMVHAASKEGKKVRFPTVNRKHFYVTPEEDALSKLNEENLFLSKRCRELESEITELHSRLQEYKTSNERLLHSSKDWCEKYLKLLDQRDGREELLMTPKKRIRLSKEEVFLEDG